MSEKSDWFTGKEDFEKMASGLHSVIGSRMNYYLRAYVDKKNLGHVMDASATYNFNDNLPKREPDVSFVSLEKMAIPPDEDITLAPDIAVEVISKNDKVFEIKRKIRQYQQAGVKIVWLLNPEDCTADVYYLEKGLKSESLVGDDELDGGNVIPGFKLPVSELFKFGG